MVEICGNYQHRIPRVHKRPGVEIVGTSTTCPHNHSAQHMEQDARLVASGITGVMFVVLARKPNPAANKPSGLAKDISRINNTSKDKVYMPWIPLKQMLTYQREPHQIPPNSTFTPCA